MDDDIIKTWPAFMDVRKTLQVFTHDWGNFYFTLGRGHPAQEPKRIWHTHRGRILGWHRIERIVKNDGSLPKLRSLSDVESEWQIKPDNWVAVCPAPFHRLKEKLYYSGFRGWRYFDLQIYKRTTDSKVRL